MSSSAYRGLRRLKAPPRTMRLIAFDTETWPTDPWNPEGKGEHRFGYGTVFDGEEHFEFTDRQQIAEFLTSRRWAGWTAWCCNAEYDLNAVFEEPDWPLSRVYFGGILKSASLTVRQRERERRGEDRRLARRNNELLRVFDTLNHWRGADPTERGGITAYGKLMGYPKLDMHISEIGPTVTPKLRDYCKRDTEIAWRMVMRMQEAYNDLGCELKGSIAATALDLFRRKYLDPRHEHRELPRAFVEQARQCYYGARTENFVVGTYHDITVADVNSMYPSVMATTLMPLFHEIRQTNTLPDSGEGFALVDVEVPDTMYPPLPFRWDKLYFPIGRWIGCYTLLELRYAITQGAIIHKVLGAVVMPESAVVFRPYVEDLYAKRVATDDPVMRLAYKTLLNSCYGKFGQAGAVARYLPAWHERGVPSKRGWKVEREESKPAPYANMVWAAQVTAGARTRLHGLLVRHDGIYCDTDSVFTRDRVVETTSLGALSEKYVADEVEIRAPKVYRTPRECRIKGVRGAKALPDQGEFFYRKPTRFRESLIRGCRPNTWGDVRRVLTYRSDKRAYARDGSSRPLTVDEIRRRTRLTITVGPMILPDPEGKPRSILPVHSPPVSG